MGVRDAIVLNTTGSNFEAIQADDTVRIKGDNTELLSIRNSNGDTILSVDTVNASVNLTGNVTGSANISGSANTTASFGRFDGTTFAGDGSDLSVRTTLPRFTGFLTGSAQIASEISGAFTSGFEYDGTIIAERKTTGGVWSTSGAMIVGRGQGGFTGTQNAAIYVGGYAYATSPESWYGDGNKSYTEEYNGSNWSVATCFPLPVAPPVSLGPAGPDSSYKVGTGAQNASIFFGGDNQYQTPRSTGSAYTYDGSSFTKVASMPELVSRHAGSGTQDATISFGGNVRSTSAPYPTSDPNCSHEWNGTSWSNFDPLITARVDIASTPNGTSESTIAIGKGSNSPSEKLSTECWNGSNWSEVADMILPRTRLAGSGTPSDGMTFGGQENAGSPAPATSEIWNGTTWSVGAAMTRGIHDVVSVRGAGSGAAGLAAGTSRPNTCTEHYDGVLSSTGSFGRIIATSLAGNATNISSSLFLGTNAISGSSKIASEISGSFNKGFNFTGNISGSSTSSGSFGRIDADFFEGNANFISSSISVGDNIISSSAQLATDISGSFTSGFEFAGTITAVTKPNAHGGLLGVTSIGPSMSTGLSRDLGVGTSPVAALAISTGDAELYDGTTWSNASPATPFPNNNAGDEWGSVNDAAFVFFGGTTYTWDGASFETKPSGHNANNPGFPSSAGAGVTSNAGLRLDNGGKTECYNGSTWSEVNAMPSDATTQYGMSGTSTDALKAGGYSGGVQIWTGTDWSEGASLSNSTVYGRYQGSSNIGLYSAGNELPAGGYGQEEWNGTTWSDGGHLVIAVMHQQSLGNASSQGGLTFGGSGAYPSSPYLSPQHTPSDASSWVSNSRLLQIYELPNTVTGSFGRVVSSTISGDATNISSSIFTSTNVVTSSAQLATDISGSFTSGFEFTGTIGGEVVTAGGVWSAGGDLIVPKSSGAMTGTQNAGLYVAGYLTGASPYSWYGNGNRTFTEEYNGTNWSAGTDFPLDSEGTNLFPLAPAGPDPANKAGTGTQNAALVFGGQSHYSTPRSTGSAFEYDGTAYTQVASMPEPISFHIGAGTQNATISYGGSERGLTSPYPATPAQYANTWDGNTWSNITATIYARTGLASTPNGTINSTMAFGATANSPDIKSTECWNGDSWSECPEQNIRRVNLGGAGSPDDAQVFGGQPSAGSSGVAAGGTSEYWNGLTWNTGAQMVRYGGAAGDGNAIRGAGSATSALAAGGYPGYGMYTGTEEYHGPAISTGSFGRLIVNNITGDATPFSSSLYSSTNVVTSSVQIASEVSGAFTSGFEFSGTISGSSTSTGSFGRLEAQFLTGDGSGISAELFRGTNLVSGSAQLATDISGSFDEGFEFTGTIGTAAAAWSTTANINVARNGAKMADASANAAVMFGGRLGTNPTNQCGFTCTEEYDGSSWSLGGSMIIQRMHHYGFGTQTAAVATMGISGSLTHPSSNNTTGYRSALSKTEHYDGSSWSEATDIINSTRGSHGFANGTQNAGVVSNGYMGSPTSLPDYDECTFTYNGTNWTQVACSPIRQYMGGSAGDTSGMVIGGSGLPHSHPHHTGLPGAYADRRAQRYNCASDSWDTLPNLSVTHVGAAGFGTTNNTYIAGGQAQPTNSYNIGHSDVLENFDGTTWSTCTNIPVATRFSSAAGLGSGILAAGCQGPVHPGSADATAVGSYSWNEFKSTGSFTDVFADDITGDFSNMRGSVFSHLNAVSGAAQIASDISGSFNKGFTHSGLISGSVGTTGSFGRIDNAHRPEQIFYTGDGRNLTLPTVAGAISSSRQIDVAGSTGGAFVTGAFSSGFDVSSGSFGIGLISGSATSTASFGLINPKGDTVVHEFTFTGSKDRHAFQLPVFTDVDLNYQAYEAEYSTGSLSGSVERVADVVVGQEAGEFYFHSDKNALAYTYSSRSLASQSLSLTTFTYQDTAGGALTQSIGLATQSFYNHTIVTCYITGSQVY